MQEWLPQYPREKGSTHVEPDKPIKTHTKPEAKLQTSNIAEVTDPVTASIIRLIDSAGKWSGTMTELLAVLNNTDQHGFVGKNDWPEDAHGLGKRLKKLEQKLSEQGIYTKRTRTQERRKLEIGRTETIQNI